MTGAQFPPLLYEDNTRFGGVRVLAPVVTPACDPEPLFQLGRILGICVKHNTRTETLSVGSGGLGLGGGGGGKGLVYPLFQLRLDICVKHHTLTGIYRSGGGGSGGREKKEVWFKNSRSGF